MKEVPLTGSDRVAIVSDEDYDLVKDITWQYHLTHRGSHASARGVLTKEIDGKKWFRSEYMHRLIMGAKDGEFVDHIDGNPLNNQRSNLRLVNPLQSVWNRGKMKTTRGRTPRSKYIGVTTVTVKNKQGKKYTYWRPQIIVDGKLIVLGNTKDEEEAARIYDAGAKQYRGEFARLNFPD